MSDNFERLGNYILLEKINAGGMAEVYLSKSVGANGINKFLAIKRILPQFADNREFIEMFKEEAKIAVNLNHNNLVSIIDFKASQNQLYLVMEYVQGQNLRQLLQQKKKKGLSLSLDFIVYLIREVSAGLDHAHRCVDKTTGKPLNIIHRDMSPQNIMVSYDGEIKIVDFGIAKAEAAGEATRVGTLKGKFSYMSPEQAEGLVIDQVSDIFSLGIILWELIADDRLFVANNEMNILKRIKECDIPELRRVNPTVPVELERIVKKALMKDHSLRYQTSSDLQKDLTRFLNKEYPDFTPSDFSTFMKFLFESEYSHAQERMVTYARLDFGSLNELSEATQFTKVPIVSPPPPKYEPPEPPANLNIEQNQNGKTGMTAVGSMSGMPELPSNNGEFSAIQNAPTQVSTPNKTKQVTLSGIKEPVGLKKRVPPKTNNSQISYVTRSGVTSTGIRYRTPTKPPTSDLAKLFFTLLIIGIIGGGLILGSSSKLRNNLPKTILSFIESVFPHIANIKPTPSHPTKCGPKDTKCIPGDSGDGLWSSTAPMYSVYVTSNPGRARIYINSKDEGVTTPATIQVEANKKFTLTLLADGYLQYTVQQTASKDNMKISANLTQVKFGYLNINVINAGVDTIIYINNLELKDRPPITKYPVPVNQPISIKAVHNFSSTSAETTVTVDVDEKKTVDLILSAPTRERKEIRQ